MNREAPPPLAFARQWTQPTSLEHQTLSRVHYPLRQLDSPSPSPPSHSRTPLSPALLWNSANTTSRSTGTRLTRQPLVAVSANASPLPTRPTPPLSSSSSFVEGHYTPPTPSQRQQASPFVVSSDTRVHTDRREQRIDTAASPNDEDAGRRFWRQQAQRFEEANAALRQELSAVYRVLGEVPGRRATENICDRISVVGETDAFREDSARPSSGQGSHGTRAGDGAAYAVVVQERNVARIELAQEREKNFLLRHRLRETEREVERLEARLRAVGDRTSRYRRSPPHRLRTAAGSKGAPRPSLPVSRRSQSRSTSQAPSTASALASVRSSLPKSPSRETQTSSPRPRSGTRRQSPHHTSREGKSRSVLSANSNAKARLSPLRVSRGYARLQHRRETHSHRASCSSSFSSSSLDDHPHGAYQSPPLSSAQESFSSVPRTSSSLSQRCRPAPQREANARALLSSLLAVHPTPAQPSASHQQQHNGDLVLSSLSETWLHEEGGAAPRHIFRSQLFDTSDSAIRAEREGSEEGIQGTFIARQLVSPTPPLRASPSPMERSSLTHVLAQHLSGSGTWASVSLTTEEDAGESEARPSTCHLFSL